MRSQNNQGRNHFLLLLVFAMATKQNADITSLSSQFKMFRVNSGCKLCSRRWINIGQYFQLSYSIPEYGNCSTETLWMLDMAHICKLRNATTIFSKFPIQFLSIRKAQHKFHHLLHHPSSHFGLTISAEVFQKHSIVLRNPDTYWLMH